MLKIENLLDLEQTISKKYLEQFQYPWEALEGIGVYIVELGNTLNQEEYKQIDTEIWIHNTAQIAPTAHISGPCIIGPHTQVRHCAFIRGNALIGEHCVVGNSVELKNVILFNCVQVPHYNYVGDSILGYYAHMGASSLTSNVKADKSLVEIKDKIHVYKTNRKKVGAILGDYTEIGCGSILNPGTIIGRNTNVYPLVSVRGVIGENSIVKSNEVVIKKK